MRVAKLSSFLSKYVTEWNDIIRTALSSAAANLVAKWTKHRADVTANCKAEERVGPETVNDDACRRAVTHTHTRLTGYALMSPAMHWCHRLCTDASDTAHLWATVNFGDSSYRVNFCPYLYRTCSMDHATCPVQVGTEINPITGISMHVRAPCCMVHTHVHPKLGLLQWKIRCNKKNNTRICKKP